MLRKKLGVGVGVALVLTACEIARAADVPVAGLKLIIVDKLAATSRAKAVFVVKDVAVTKGAGTDPVQIDARLDVAYDSVSGAFLMPQGAGWIVNSTSVAKYVNKSAPVGGATKVGIIKPGALVKVVGKSLGDSAIDVSKPPCGPVFVAHSVNNAAETNRHCTRFDGCSHKEIAGGTGHKLVCRLGTGDAACTAAGPWSRFINLGATVRDTCTELEWEKKNGLDGNIPGNGVSNPGNAQDVDNRYVWAGECTGPNPNPNFNARCQPTAAAESACKAATTPAFWSVGCEPCGIGEGPCVVAPALATVWEWIEQVNAATFASHADWRLATSAGSVVNPTGQSAELESIVDPYIGNCAGDPFNPCIDPVFGPTVSTQYWSQSTYADGGEDAWCTDFATGYTFACEKDESLYVRAVRDWP